MRLIKVYTLLRDGCWLASNAFPPASKAPGCTGRSFMSSFIWYASSSRPLYFNTLFLYKALKTFKEVFLFPHFPWNNFLVDRISS